MTNNILTAGHVPCTSANHAPQWFPRLLLVDRRAAQPIRMIVWELDNLHFRHIWTFKVANWQLCSRTKYYFAHTLIMENSPSWTLVDYSAGGLGDREYHCWIEKLFNPSELLAPNPDAKRLSPLKLLLKKRMCHLKIPTSSNYSEGLTGWRYETLACPTSAGFLKSHFQKSLKGETEILRVDF